MKQVEPGHLVVRAYFAQAWEATRTLMQEFSQIEGETIPFELPTWGELPPGLQEAVMAKGRSHLDAWDEVVIAGMEALHLAEHHGE